MLREMIDRIAKLGQSENAIVTYKDTDLRKVFIRQGDAFSEQEIPAPYRASAVVGLDDFVKAALDPAIATAPEVFHEHNTVTLVCDRATKTETVVMKLDQTERFKKLVSLASEPPALAVRSLIRMLRFELHGTGIDAVIAVLRKLDFTRKSDGRSDIQHGRESLGKSVEAAVQQAENIPEEFLVECPVYQNPGMRDLSKVNVRMGIHLDVHDESVQIRPLADELVQAVLAAQSALGENLRSQLTGIPVFHGRA